MKIILLGKKFITMNIKYLNEVWKDIKDYEGYYQVSNFGRVKSMNRIIEHARLGKQTLKEKIMSIAFDGNYNFVGLRKNGTVKYVTIHRLVAEAFIPNPNNLPCVNHKDEDKTNNCVDNLEWCDYKYNANYGTKSKRLSVSQLNDSTKSKAVIQFDMNGNFVKEWPSLAEIKRILNISKSCISYVCDGRYKSSHNYLWKWK